MIHVPRELPLEMVLCRLLEFAVATFCRICDKRMPLQIYVTLGLTQNNKPNSGGTRTTLPISCFPGAHLDTTTKAKRPSLTLMQTRTAKSGPRVMFYRGTPHSKTTTLCPNGFRRSGIWW